MFQLNEHSQNLAIFVPIYVDPSSGDCFKGTVIEGTDWERALPVRINSQAASTGDIGKIPADVGDRWQSRKS